MTHVRGEPARRPARLSAAVLLVIVGLGPFSFGIFFWPAAVLMTTAAVMPTAETGKRDDDPGRSLNLVAVGLAAAALILLFTAGTLAGSVDWRAMRRPSPGVIAISLAWLGPVAVSALPLVVRGVRVVRILRISATVLLWLLSLATFTVFFMPSAVFMLLAALRPTGPAELGSTAT